MYDSSVKIPSGLITGNHKTLGNFDECLSVSSNEHGFVGQACNVGIQFNITPNDDSLTHELDLGDLLRNVATASVSPSDGKSLGDYCENRAVVPRQKFNSIKVNNLM